MTMTDGIADTDGATVDGEAHGVDPARVNLMDPAIQACPFDAYRTLRDEAPVYRMPDLGMYVVTRYDDLHAVLRNTTELSMKKAGSLVRTPAARKIFEDKGFRRYYAMGDDPPVHTAYRQIVDQAFTAGRIRKLVPYIESVVDGLIDSMPQDEDFDFVKAFCVPLPLIMITRILGLPAEDMPQLKEWSDYWVEVHSYSLTPERELLVARKGVELQEYLLDWFDRKRKDPQEDLITDIAHGLYNGERPLNINEAVSLAEHVLVGGNETTTNGLAMAMRLMIETPGLEAGLRAEPEKIKVFVEEALRLQSPTQGLERQVVKDMELHGISIPKGGVIHIRFGAANRDERHFADPDVLDLDRKNAASHMAFGQGTHHCLGSPLARQEMNTAFERLVARRAGFALAEGRNRFEFVETLALRIPKDLWIRCREG